ASKFLPGLKNNSTIAQNLSSRIDGSKNKKIGRARELRRSDAERLHCDAPRSRLNSQARTRAAANPARSR
ncbi:MAG TPA: hypothetical protein VIK01_16755, partial [Polyangiaceae bacterium]